MCWHRRKVPRHHQCCFQKCRKVETEKSPPWHDANGACSHFHVTWVCIALADSPFQGNDFRAPCAGKKPINPVVGFPHHENAKQRVHESTWGCEPLTQNALKPPGDVFWIPTSLGQKIWDVTFFLRKLQQHGQAYPTVPESENQMGSFALGLTSAFVVKSIDLEVVMKPAIYSINGKDRISTGFIVKWCKLCGYWSGCVTPV